jgi:hypothetical protein
MRNDPVTAPGPAGELVIIRGSTLVHREDAFKSWIAPDYIPIRPDSEVTVR